eukprot:2796635-Alexandrium_andersonii.AAC.1
MHLGPLDSCCVKSSSLGTEPIGRRPQERSPKRLWWRVSVLPAGRLSATGAWPLFGWRLTSIGRNA